MEYQFRPMSEADAHDVAAWEYEEPYTVYNGDPIDVPSLADPRNAYYSIRDGSGVLIGYCCFGSSARVPGGTYDESALDVGLGIRPDLTGQGLGLAFFKAILGFARASFRPRRFRLTVATFNRRAIAVYEGAGFTAGQTFRSTAEGRHEFMIMTMPA